MISGDRLRGQTEGGGIRRRVRTCEEGGEEKLVPHCSVSD